MPEYVTPLMQQYAQIKAQYPDCILLFRLGDFYELFAEDAKLGAELLNITLTRKAQSKGGDVPMAGVPFHALDTYLAKLVSHGHNVAICEQTTLPGENGQKLVEREVVRIVTPGTVLAEHSLEQKENAFVVSILFDRKLLSLAWADLTTGEMWVTEKPLSDAKRGALPDIIDELSRFHPREAIFPPNLAQTDTITALQERFPGLKLHAYPSWDSYAHRAEALLCEQFGVRTLAGFGLENAAMAQQTAAALLGYLEYTQQQTVTHIRSLRSYRSEPYVILDTATIYNLELFHSLRHGDTTGSLLHVIDQTVTALGGRRMRHWLRFPLRDAAKINERLDAIEWLLANSSDRERLQKLLRGVGDIERLLGRISVGTGSPRDLKRLQQSLSAARETLRTVPHSAPKKLTAHTTAWNAASKLDALVATLESWLVDEPPVDPKLGGLIRSGVDAELDVLRSQTERSQEWIAKLEHQERLATQIPNLKIRSNKVFGFYIEISKSHLGRIPAHYDRKQTLVNAERFITPELKQEEEKLLRAEGESQKREFAHYLTLLKQTLAATDAIQTVAKAVSVLDVLCSFAQLAEEQRYCRPQLVTSGQLTIKQGRHPVVERLFSGARFVPNDTFLTPATETQQIGIITGPNMAGKSVYIRQVALITLMAHLGSFVPAESAEVSIVDRIFVRSGASDAIAAGLSTFMVEMVEAAHILNHATTDSLIVMDEIGRGTSTYDGISLAWAIAEYLATEPTKQAKTLFATHYHELQALAEQYPNIKNLQVLVEEHNSAPVFLHQVVPGAASHSFGVAVAKLAGVPTTVTTNANTLLHHLEAQRTQPLALPGAALTELAELDVESLTPLAALQLLHSWKSQIDTPIKTKP